MRQVCTKTAIINNNKNVLLQRDQISGLSSIITRISSILSVHVHSSKSAYDGSFLVNCLLLMFTESSRFLRIPKSIYIYVIHKTTRTPVKKPTKNVKHTLGPWQSLRETHCQCISSVNALLSALHMKESNKPMHVLSSKAYYRCLVI